MMPALIMAPVVPTFPPKWFSPIVQTKKEWQDYWQTQPDLLATSLSTGSAGREVNRLDFERRYGKAKDTHEAAIAVRTERDLADHWVRVRVPTADAADLETIWLGRISTEETDKFASSVRACGVQQWVALGPGQILRKRAIGTSFHTRITAADLQEVGWVPPLNNPRDSEVGNRSENKLGDAYTYGGTELWSYRDYVEYLLKHFLDEKATAGPEWHLAGQAGVLEDFQAPIRWGTTQTVYEMLRRLVPLSRGMDYTIKIIHNRTPSQGPDWPEAGFEIYVYAVSPDPQVFAGKTLPPNPSGVDLDIGTAADTASPPRVIVSHDRKYGKIVLRGKPIVVCCSLWGEKAVELSEVPEAIGIPSSTYPTLGKCWSDDLEVEYKLAAGATSSDEADVDRWRHQDKFRSVYASLGAPPDWDMNGGTAAPWCDGEGQLRLDDEDTEENESHADHQLIIRRTLPWTPMKADEDWTDIRNKPTLNRGDPTGVDGIQADYLPPSAWIFDRATYAYFDAAKAGIGVRPKRDDWGVELRASPNHLMGFNHFGQTGSSLITAKWSLYDWEAIAVTIAFEFDQRFTMTWETEDWTPKDGVYETEVDAELHYLAPNTIVGADWGDMSPRLKLSGDAGRVIRHDLELMGVTMAGCIQRYGFGRSRASLDVKGLWPWHDLVGDVLGTIDESGTAHIVDGVICGVEWSMPLSGSPRTKIRAGYAL